MRYIVQVPVEWSGTVNHHRVEIEYGEVYIPEQLEEIRNAARSHVAAKGLTVLDTFPTNVYRKRTTD